VYPDGSGPTARDASSMLRSSSTRETTTAAPEPGSWPAPGTPLPTRLRGFAVDVAVLLASVAACLLAFEAGTRLFSRIGPALLLTDPVVGKRYVPGWEGRVFVDEAGREVTFRFNRDGFRGPDRPRAKPPGTRRIAVVGDSMISAMATDEDETLVRRLEVSLGARWPDEHVEVLNFGVSSSSTGEELALYRRLVADYEPDLVLLAFFVGNDFSDNSRRLTQAPRIYFDLDDAGALRREWAPSAPGPLTRWLNLHSRFYVWQKRAFRILHGSLRAFAGSGDPGSRIFEPPNDPDLAHAWDLLAALLRQFQKDTASRASRFAVLVIPCADQVHDDLWTGLVAQAGARGRQLDRLQPQRRLAEIARAAAIPLLDLTPAFRRIVGTRSADDPGPRLFLNGRSHLSSEGQRVAALEVVRFLTQGAGSELMTPPGGNH
jgi:hypothetical protein